MKNFTIFIFLLLVFTKTQAQNYLINFAGTGASSTVDSVKIENLTNGTSKSISGSEVLSLDVVTTTYQIKGNSNKSLKVYPNPFYLNTTIEFFVPKPGITTIGIYDQCGRVIAQEQSKLELGLYTYQIEGLAKGLYTLQVKSGSFSYSAKILNQQENKSKATISCKSINKDVNTLARLKSTSTIPMAYTVGDQLLFTGYSGIYGTVGGYVVTESKTISFNFVDCTDGNNRHYTVLPHKGRIWMAENLSTPAYYDGTPIPYVTDTTRKSAAYTWYTNSDGSIKANYGALYNWLVVGTGNLCPTGWHVASDYEWSSLQSELGTNAGGKLKATTDWGGTNYGATNEIGFNAFPGGFCDHSFVHLTDQYRSFGTGGYWWTSSPIEGGDFAYYRALSSESGNIISYYYGDYRRSKYFSVRCVKNY